MKKQKTRQAVNWPTTTLFTLQDLFKANPTFKKITLRVRLMSEIENGRMTEIAAIPGNKGRPQKVFTATPVTQTVIDRVNAENLMPVDNINRLLTVTSIKPAQPAVHPVLSKVSVATH